MDNLPKCAIFVLFEPYRGVCVCVCVCVYLSPQRFHFTNLPVQTVPSLRRRLSSSWFMSLIKPCVCVCVCVCSSGPYCPLQSLHKLFSQPLPPSVADNSCECGCECFRSALVRLVSLSEGTLVTASLLISNLPWRSLKGRRSKTKLLPHSSDGDTGHSVCLCWGVCVCVTMVGSSLQLMAHLCFTNSAEKILMKRRFVFSLSHLA